MAGIPETKAASYYGPVARATPTDGGQGNNVIRFATSSTAASQALNTDTKTDGEIISPWWDKYVDIHNEDLVNPLEVAFSDGAAGVTLFYGRLSASFNAGAADSAWRLNPGETKSVICPRGSTFFNYVQPAAVSAATVALYCSEGVVSSR
jgi:hypothetical protein